MNIHHIGYLIDNIDASISEMKKLGFNLVSEIIFDDIRRAKIAFIKNNGYMVELIQPIDQDSPIYGLRKKHKNSPYHICYKTDNLEDTIDSLCAVGFMAIVPPQDAPAIEGCPKVAFLMSSQIGMIELVEEGSRDILNEFMNIIAHENPYQLKYLKTAMEDITVKEIEKLENLIKFYIMQGDDLAGVTKKYLNLIDFLMEDQRYFLEKGHYRFSSFAEAEELYKNSSYMDSYVVGLGLSTYLWHVHRDMMRFFLKQCRKLANGKKYLEIGPGHGEYFVTAMENTDFESYYAVDISETSVNTTKAFCEYSLGNNTKKNYQVLHKDFFEYTSDSKFDAIVMGEVLEHVEKPLQFLNKIFEVAMDDAFIYITTAVNAPQPDHIYHFETIDDVLDLFKTAHFDVIDRLYLTANNVSIEKAIKKKYAIVVGFALKKMV